jgi:hypothetical protein
VSAMEIVGAQAFTSVAFPIIGAGSGGLTEERALSACGLTMQLTKGA